VQAVLDDYQTAPLFDEERVLFCLIDKIVTDSSLIGQSDIDEAHAAGWTDEALYDAITVVSLFQFYNCWIDSTGVADLPAAVYETMSHRMATGGYAPD
jgi:alkylhydroperoxidase family enzyme